MYKSNKNAVLYSLKLAKHEFCVKVGTLLVAEVKPITPVNKDPQAPTRGNLKKSIASDVMSGDKGVFIGVTDSAPYGIFVNEGSSKQPAQHFLDKGANNGIPKITNVAVKLYKNRMR